MSKSNKGAKMNEVRIHVLKTASNIYNIHKSLEERFKSYLVHFYRWVYAC